MTNPEALPGHPDAREVLYNVLSAYGLSKIDEVFAALDAAGLVVVDRDRFERLQRMALKAKEMGRTTFGLQDSDFEPLRRQREWSEQP